MLRFLILLLLTSPALLFPKVQLSSVFSDRMVLQQRAIAPIWGRAEPGEAITVEATWDPMQLTTYADSKGLWRIDMQTPEAGGPYQILIKGSNQLLIEDVLIGEVWIASGQSNMHWPVKRSVRADETIEDADVPEIRLFQVERTVSTTPRFDGKGSWKNCHPETVANFSAIAYHFGRELFDSLQVPIGIIQTTWGGSPVEAWTSREMLGEVREFGPYLEEFDDAMREYRAHPEYPDPVTHKSPTVLFNAMLHPLIPFAMQGIIWYQGEANVSDPYLYRKLFPTMIQDWRQRWGWRFSFYYVQLAPYQYTVPMSGAGLREAQFKTLSVANTGMASTMDVGNPFDIHPRDKKTVGHRLARLALQKNYGVRELIPSGPKYDRLVIDGDKMQVLFRYAEGLRDGGHALKAFEMAGADRQFHPADAEIVGESIVVSSSEVSRPFAVRYAFSDTSQAALYNRAGLPASSFRTDNWTLFFTKPRIEASYLPDTDEFDLQLVYRQILDHDIHYTLDGSEPMLDSPIYEKPMRLKGPQEIRAQVFIDGQASPYEARRVLLKHLGMGKALPELPETPARYRGRLLDGLQGTKDYRDGDWFGLAEKDLVLIVDLGEKLSIQQIETQFLRDQDHRVFLPSSIKYEVSSNGNRYKEIRRIEQEDVLEQSELTIQTANLAINPTKARYLRLTIENPGSLPSWHPQAGGQTLVLLDEIIIR